MDQQRQLLYSILRVTPFVLLSAFAYTLCVLIMLDASSSPLTFTDNARVVVAVLLFLPATSSFEIEYEKEMLAGLILGGALGVLVCGTYATIALGVPSAWYNGATITFLMLGAIMWCVCSLVYIVFFMFGNLLRDLHNKLWPRRYRMVA